MDPGADLDCTYLSGELIPTIVVISISWLSASIPKVAKCSEEAFAKADPAEFHGKTN